MQTLECHLKASVATQWSPHTLHSCDAVPVIARVMNIIVIKIKIIKITHSQV